MLVTFLIALITVAQCKPHMIRLGTSPSFKKVLHLQVSIGKLFVNRFLIRTTTIENDTSGTMKHMNLLIGPPLEEFSPSNLISRKNSPINFATENYLLVLIYSLLTLSTIIVAQVALANLKMMTISSNAQLDVILNIKY